MVEVSTKPEVAEIQQKIEWIEQNLANETPLKEIFSSNSPKRDMLLKWGEYLEELAKLGIYQKPLSSISRHISQRLYELGLEKTVPYVRVVLPFKYKDANLMRSDEDLAGRESFTPISSKYARENHKLIRLCQDTAEAYFMVSEKLEKKPFMSLLDKKQKKIEGEFLLKWRTMLKSLKQVADERNEVPHSKQFLFLYCKTLGTLGVTYTKFVKYLREFAEISSKQAGKIIQGKSSYLDPMYEPKNRLEAKDLGFYGFPCNFCGSWRCHYTFNVDQSRDMIFCYHCQEWDEPKTEPLPREK